MHERVNVIQGTLKAVFHSALSLMGTRWHCANWASYSQWHHATAQRLSCWVAEVFILHGDLIQPRKSPLILNTGSQCFGLYFNKEKQKDGCMIPAVSKSNLTNLVGFGCFSFRRKEAPGLVGRRGSSRSIVVCFDGGSTITIAFVLPLGWV